MADNLSRSDPKARGRGAVSAPWLEGWNLTLAAAAVVASLGLAIVLVDGASPRALGLAIRVTAWTSFALFTAAFTASALHRLWPGPFTRWQRRNRRYLGVGFAASHGLHAAAIVSLAKLYPIAFDDHARHVKAIPGLIGYALLAAMTATSFDRTAAWIGRRAWKLLHTVGALYLWGAFANAFITRALRMPGYWLPASAVLAAMALRIAAWWQQRRTRARRRAPLNDNRRPA
jgi:sulfoxide reductase heme-binding subunit YedZ